VLTLRPISVICSEDRHAGADARRVSSYLLDKSARPQAFAVDGDFRGVNSLWVGVGDTLTKLGLDRGKEVMGRQLEAVLEGRHATTGAIVRPGRWIAEKGRVVGSIEATFSVPKSVSVVWSLVGAQQRADIEQAVLTAADRALQYLMRTREVVRRRVDDERVSEVAHGFAASATLHAVSRPAAGERVPSPQLHVHTAVVGVEGRDGVVRSPDRHPLFTNGVPLEGGAVFRAMLAHELVMLGYDIEPGTGAKRRYFEIAGVPEGLRSLMSARTHEILARREDIEAIRQQPMTGREAARLALLTRRHKLDVEPEVALAIWRAQGMEFEFGRAEGEALVGVAGYRAYEAARWREAREAVEEYMRDRGPTVSATGARTIAFEVAAGRMSFEDAHALVQELQREGALLTLAAGDREPRVTTPWIRELESRVMDVATRAAAREDAPLSARARRVGLVVANDALGEGHALFWEQEQAFRMLTGGTGWGVVTGRAGTGKGPTLHAVAAAYEADGWQVIPCATDGTNATRLGHDLSGGRSGDAAIQAYSITQAIERVRRDLLTVNHRTLILIDEASKVGAEQWWEIAKLVDRHSARVAAVGHAGQHDAIRLPGLFKRMVDEDSGIPVRRLVEIRRHRDPNDPSKVHPWLPEYQVALDEGHAADAIEILRDNSAIFLHDTRQEAMKAMVAEWEQWRRPYAVEQCVMLVHGSNADVDMVNVLAQQQRYENKELSQTSIEAVDRPYSLRVGDPVMMRNSAYDFEPDEYGRRRPRITNGQVGVVTGIDVERDVVTVAFIGPGKEDRRSEEIDLGRLRRAHADDLFRRATPGTEPTQAPPALRLVYACHTFPEQGATELGTAELGHAGQGKEGTYVAGTRAKFRHSVHLAREDLLTLEELDIPGIVASIAEDEYFQRYAQKIERAQSRESSIAFPLHPGAPIGGTLPSFAPAARFPGPGRNTAHLVEPGDPLEPYVRLLGEDAAARLDVLARSKERSVGKHDDGWLLRNRDRTARALERLDGAAALAVARVQDQRHTLEREASEARLEVDSLTTLASERGTTRRRRRDLLEEAMVWRGVAERAEARSAGLDDVEVDIRRNGRHPEDWLRDYGHTAASWIATERELAFRRELDTLELSTLEREAAGHEIG
jgi:conjugative relaxase-like TrwC/TraI family protein